jgi:hypothetical protein
MRFWGQLVLARANFAPGHQAQLSSSFLLDFAQAESTHRSPVRGQTKVVGAIATELALGNATTGVPPEEGSPTAGATTSVARE